MAQDGVVYTLPTLDLSLFDNFYCGAYMSRTRHMDIRIDKRLISVLIQVNEHKYTKGAIIKIIKNN